jgi:hypothetical protein
MADNTEAEDEQGKKETSYIFRVKDWSFALDC